MKLILLAFVVSFAIAFAQEPQDPDSVGAYRQEPAEYPEGLSCSPNGTMAGGRVIDPSPEHKCSCKRMDSDPLCEGEGSHESDCLQYCHEHKNKCSCPIACDGKSHGAAPEQE